MWKFLRVFIFILFFFISCLKDLRPKLKELQLDFLNNLSLTELNFQSIPSIINEGTTGTFAVRLQLQPTDTVNIPISFTRSGFIQFDKTSISISPDAWNQWHSVFFYVVNDDYYEKSLDYNLNIGPVSTSDLVYNGKFYTFPVRYTNNDINSVQYYIVPVFEDNYNGSIQLQLTSKPKSDVTINLDLSPNSDVTIGSTSVTFTPTNYNIPQIVSLNYISDILYEGNENYPLTISTTSSDPDYDQLSYSNVVTIQDDDVPDIIFTSNYISLVEGNSTNVGVKLGNLAPTANVTLNLTTSDPSICTISSGSSLTFTPANYNTPQNITIQAKSPDNIDNLGNTYNCTITATATSSDVNYNGITRDMYVWVYDLFDAGLNVPSFSPTTINESGTVAITYLRLSTLPTSPVKVCIRVSDYCEAYVETSGGLYAPDGSCTSIAGANTPYAILDSTNWSGGFTVTVRGRHDWNYRNANSLPETGGQCGGPYPDGTKSIQIFMHTQCSGCNSYEAPYYNSGNVAIITQNLTSQDDLDRYTFLAPSHNGNIFGDSSLQGNNEIDKADYYCSLNIPTSMSGTYKAFITSDNRKCNDATCSSPTNWILQKNKYYFRQNGSTLAFKTELSNPIFDFGFIDNQGFDSGEYWTGFLTTSQWQLDTYRYCSNWSSDSSLFTGTYGTGNSTSYDTAVSNTTSTCDQSKQILCIQQ